MKPKKIIVFSLFYFMVLGNAQEKRIDSTAFPELGWEVSQTKQKLDKHFFASTPSIQLKVNNEEFTYTNFQLGKRKNKIYVYLRILKDNVCIKKDKNVDIYLKSGEIFTLKNEYFLNCNSVFVRQLSRKELDKLRKNTITLIKMYTYKKNYEMHVNEANNQKIHHDIEHLSKYKIRKSTEVKGRH